MNKELLKPALSKILVFWLTLSLLVLVLLVLFSWRELTDVFTVLFAGVIVLIQCLILTAILFSLPYFRLEINDAELIGPGSMLGSWSRAHIPLADLDLQNVNSKFRWLGFYGLKAKGGGAITLWGFDSKQYDKLLSAIRLRAAAKST